MVLAFGEILWDIIEGEAHLGGAPLNFAVHLKQMGQNAALISGIGYDEYGDQAINRLEGRGVTIAHIQRNDYPTGTVYVQLDKGEPDYAFAENTAIDHLAFDRLDLQQLADYSVFYYGTLIQRSLQSRNTLYRLLESQQFEHIFYDVNLRKKGYTKNTILYSLEHCTILKMNQSEAGYIAGLIGTTQDKLFSALTEQYPKMELMLVTRGEEGCLVSFNKEVHAVPGVKAKVKDTIGAGDAFSAAFLSSFIREGDPLKAAGIANRVGAFVACSTGATPSYPDGFLEEIGLL